MKTFYLTAMAVVTGMVSSYAQPTLNQTNCAPQMGDEYITHSSNYVSPGPGGSNQSWNFSSLTSSGMDTISIYTSSYSSQASSFPGASLVSINSSSGGQNEGFFDVTSSSYSFHGYYAGGPQPVTVPYSNPEDMLQYPLQYQGSFTDNFGGSYTNQSIQMYRNGTKTVTADGYGDLQMPYGTVTNVLRVQSISNFSDSSIGGTIQYIDTVYRWFKPGVNMAILTLQSLTTVGFNTVYTCGYLDQTTVGVSNTSQIGYKVKIAPNPASSTLNLDLNITSATEGRVEIVDMNGKKVLVKQFPRLSPGNNHIPVNIDPLNSGIYLIKVETENNVTVERFVKN